MPGLVRGVARTAVIAGTATAVSNRVSRRQAGRWAGQEQQQAAAANEPAPAPAPPAEPGGISAESMAKLQQLADLKTQGILTEVEFQAQKQRILAGG